MKLSFVEPRAELKPYIQSFWVFESTIGLPPTENSLAAPNGCPKLIIPYENSITSIANGHVEQSQEHGLYFVGNQHSSTLLRTSPRKTGFIGIEFYPHGAFPIFGIPMVETTNRLLSADERKTGYTRRYLEILFKNHVGISPKVLAGIFRFQRFYRKWAQRRPYDELREELYDYYYDQAHFTKEFKRMTGFTPQHFTLEVSNEFGRRLSVQ